jgi:uncharacterized protein YceK
MKIRGRSVCGGRDKSHPYQVASTEAFHTHLQSWGFQPLDLQISAKFLAIPLPFSWVLVLRIS